MARGLGEKAGSAGSAAETSRLKRRPDDICWERFEARHEDRQLPGSRAVCAASTGQSFGLTIRASRCAATIDARHFISRYLEAGRKPIFRRAENLDAEFLEPTFQQLGRARIGVYDQYARRRRNLR